MRQHSDRLWVWGEEIDGGTLAQASRAAALPIVAGHVALMPDAHVGIGATVGSVIPTRGAIIPAAVGVDIGCGMIAVETFLEAKHLPDDLGPLLDEINRAVPAGVGQGHERGYKELVGDRFLRDHPNRSVQELGLAQKAATQLGSLGSGNHFVEVSVDGADGVWVVLHSGSRGVGNVLATHHIQEAKGLMKAGLEDPDLAWLSQGTPEFDAYVTDLQWAQSYALTNRESMMDAVLDVLKRSVVGDPETPRDAGRSGIEWRRINCHHNYAAQEKHFGESVWVTRKGAISARADELGVIPGSMGTSTFIVRGLGNPAAFMSSSHGAGRRMSRKQAKRSITTDELTAAMSGKAWLSGSAEALVDESPAAYKDIHAVMRDQADLVEVVAELHQVLNYKGVS